MTDSFAHVIDFENLYVAYRDARASKRYRSSILKFGYRLEENLVTLRRDLVNKTYRHGGYREFVINDSKKRLIKAAPFRDRVVHHAVCNVIEPILERGFIYDSYACRNGKGTHVAVLRLEHFVRLLRQAQAVERERERDYDAAKNILPEMRHFKVF
jgi:retron-type reverse transcriptase